METDIAKADRRETLIAARLNAKTAQQVLDAESRIAWANDHDGAECPDDMIPTEATLAKSLEDGMLGGGFLEEANRLVTEVFGGPERKATIQRDGWHQTRVEARAAGFVEIYDRIIRSEDGFFEWYSMEVYSNGALPRWCLWASSPDSPNCNLVSVHEAYLEISRRDGDSRRIKHPLGPLIRSWWQRPRSMAHAVVTTAAGMTRKPELLSQIEGAAWVALVDGEPMAARIEDANALFPPGKVKRFRKQGVFRPGATQGALNIPGVRQMPRDWRLAALAGLDPILTGDALALLTLAHALDRPMTINERTGAALLARTREGEYRRPLATDIDRFWEAAYALRAMALWDPGGSWRWANLATVEANGERVVIGPPEWRREAREARYTLTGEGGQAARARIVAGKQGNAGRMVTGLEYRIAAEFDPQAETSRLLLPAAGKTGPGEAVFVPWREALWLMGDEWEAGEKADKVARERFNRAFSKLDDAGYLVSKRGEAAAGDSVEIVRRVRGSRARKAGLMVRSSARFVEAARLARLRDGKGFAPVSLGDWLGLK